MGILTPDEMGETKKEKMVTVPRKLLDSLISRCDTDRYDGEEDEIGTRVCCHVISYEDHADTCPVKQMSDFLKSV